MRGRQLSRDTEHRKALRRNMAQSLFEHGKIRTTLPKAKELVSFVEKLITIAKTPTLHSRRRVIAIMQDRRLTDEDQEFTGQSVVQKLFDDIAPKFVDRNGGYTRIIKLADYRIGDGGDIVLLQLLTEETPKPRGSTRRSAGLRRKRNERRRQFAASILKPKKEAAASSESSTSGQSEPVAEGASA